MAGADGENRLDALRDTFYTVEEVADTFDCSSAYVRQCIDDRGLPAAKLGRTWYIHREALLEWIRQGAAVEPDDAVDTAAAGHVAAPNMSNEITSLKDSVAQLQAELRAVLAEIGSLAPKDAALDAETVTAIRKELELAREESRRAREMLERREAAQEARLQRRDERLLEAFRQILEEREEMRHAWWDRWRRSDTG